MYQTEFKRYLSFWCTMTSPPKTVIPLCNYRLLSINEHIIYHPKFPPNNMFSAETAKMIATKKATNTAIPKKHPIVANRLFRPCCNNPNMLKMTPKRNAPIMSQPSNSLSKLGDVPPALTSKINATRLITTKKQTIDATPYLDSGSFEDLCSSSIDYLC